MEYLSPNPQRMTQGGGSSGTAVARPSPLVSALVVGVTPRDARSITSVLNERRFHVTIAATYAQARERLAAGPPAVLITEVRLGEYNGLQLVLHGKSIRPNMATIALSGVADPVLQADAESMGATFVPGPVSHEELAAAVFRTIFERRSPGQPVRAPFERRTGERRVTSLPKDADRRRADRRRDLDSLLEITR